MQHICFFYIHFVDKIHLEAWQHNFFYDWVFFCQLQLNKRDLKKIVCNFFSFIIVENKSSESYL